MWRHSRTQTSTSVYLRSTGSRHDMPSRRKRAMRRTVGCRHLWPGGRSSSQLGFLAIRISSLIDYGNRRFTQSVADHIRDRSSDRRECDRPKPADGDWRNVVREGIAAQLPRLDAGATSAIRRNLHHTRSSSSAMPSLPILAASAGRATLVIPLADPFDQLDKGVKSARTRRRTSAGSPTSRSQWFDQLVVQGTRLHAVQLGALLQRRQPLSRACGPGWRDSGSSGRCWSAS